MDFTQESGLLEVWIYLINNLRRWHIEIYEDCLFLLDRPSLSRRKNWGLLWVRSSLPEASGVCVGVVLKGKTALGADPAAAVSLGSGRSYGRRYIRWPISRGYPFAAGRSNQTAGWGRFCEHSRSRSCVDRRADTRCRLHSSIPGTRMALRWISSLSMALELSAA